MNTPQLHLLLADDDEDDCLFFKQALIELSANVQLTTVYNGEQLMQLLTQKLPALPNAIFLDINMPLKNGYECLAEIKLNDTLNQIPVFMLSTSSEQGVISSLYKSGATYYISKPSQFLVLKNVIEQALTLIIQGSNDQPAKENFVLTGDLRSRHP